MQGVQIGFQIDGPDRLIVKRDVFEQFETIAFKPGTVGANTRCSSRIVRVPHVPGKRLSVGRIEIGSGNRSLSFQLRENRTGILSIAKTKRGRTAGTKDVGQNV